MEVNELRKDLTHKSITQALDEMETEYHKDDRFILLVNKFWEKGIVGLIAGNLAQKFVDEHDEVMIERIGGKQGRTKGDLSGVRFAVIKVNDQPLDRLWSGKIEKGRR